jgi:hypothetical protein
LLDVGPRLDERSGTQQAADMLRPKHALAVHHSGRLFSFALPSAHRLADRTQAAFLRDACLPIRLPGVRALKPAGPLWYAAPPKNAAACS